MEVFGRLALGTANFGRPYGREAVQCPRAEQEKILSYCHSCGIDTIHTKRAYGVDLSWVSTYFQIVESDAEGNVSFYEPQECADCSKETRWNIVQVPYSPFNRIWEDWLPLLKSVATEVHVRSVFVQRKVFTSNEAVFRRFRHYARKLRLPVGTLCILFCLLNPHVDKVIIGVDSEAQLKENLRFFHRLNGFAVDDARIIDPRLWPTT